MKEKELHKLRRQDLLELLLSQSKDVARQQEDIETLKAELLAAREANEKLQGKLDEKDGQIADLIGKLDRIDEVIARLQDMK